MDDNLSSEEADCYYSSDQESLKGLDKSVLQPVSSRANTPKVITKESLLAAQRVDLRRVMELLSLKEHHARTVLIHYQWDVEKLFAVLVEKGKDSLFSGAGLTVLEKQLCDSSMLSCDICKEDVPGHQMTQMDCGHSFCNNCWAGHFTEKINEGQSKRIICMAPKCNAICDEDVVRTLVSKMQPNLAVKFDRFLLESYIEDNKMVKWCPSTPHCGNAIRAEDVEVCEVECSCGLQFCFNCLSPAHSPCSCVMWELWRKKCYDELETEDWITVHTKPCPNCHKPVEKNGGCNLVTCSCGRYQEDKEKQERAKRDLYRFMHYHNRYKAHIYSSKLEDKLSDRIRKKVSILEKREIQLKDFSWLTNGLYRLLRSRRFLSYSYPFAFYMFGDELFKDEMSSEEREIKQNLFEDQQQLLEANVEKLSLFLDEPFDQFANDEVMQIRIQVLNLSVAVDTLCKKMYEWTENELLGSLQLGIHKITPNRSNGTERATDVYSSQNSEEAACEICQPSEFGTSGWTSRLDQALRSGNSEDTTCSPKKRSRIDGSYRNRQTTLPDLNLPAEAIESGNEHLSIFSTQQHPSCPNEACYPEMYSS